MLREHNFDLVYSSGEKEPADFFYHALCNSSKFDLGLGFFNSSGFRALALGFAYFIVKKGKMRMLINNSLSVEDKEAIEKGLISDPKSLIEDDIVNNLTKLFNTLSRKDKHFFNCLSWLIADKRLEITATIPTNPSGGIAHHKFGIFTDNEGQKLAFNGSANFSRSALYNNLESIDCYPSWTNSDDSKKRIEYYDRLFENYWCGQSKAVKSIQLSKVKTFIRDNFNITKLEELVIAEEELNETENHKDRNEKLKKVYITNNNNFDINVKQPQPSLPEHIKLYDYQKIALNNWLENKNIGFFEMATGTGKTITALNCALELYKHNEVLQLLILVPTKTLTSQWREEVSNFNFHNVVVVSSENTKWPALLQKLINRNIAKPTTFCIICTYESFITDRFQSIVSKLDNNALLISDEAHNFGTKRLIEKYPHNIINRIGLSATPARHFDEEGTTTLLTYFNAVDSPTFKFSMQEAIERGFLTNYYYYPIIVNLTTTEMDEYREISEQLLRYFDSKTGSFKENPIVNILLQNRKRIIHKAKNKLDALREAISLLKGVVTDIKYTLVYVPEGFMEKDDIESRLINEYSKVISEEFGLKQHQYIGETKDRDEVIRRFAEGKIEVLTAMKCLDEGVDVKRTENAIFCASTSNPRQFIQRRGRILRVHKDKKYARIYDMIVVPEMTTTSMGNSLWMERSIFASELKRIREFASLALNKYQALESLEDIAENYELDVFST